MSDNSNAVRRIAMPVETGNIDNGPTVQVVLFIIHVYWLPPIILRSCRKGCNTVKNKEETYYV